MNTSQRASAEDSNEVVRICTRYAQHGMINIFVVVFTLTLAFACFDSVFFVGYLAKGTKGAKNPEGFSLSSLATLAILARVVFTQPPARRAPQLPKAPGKRNNPRHAHRP
ncbi:MAG: hypothetical protein ACOYOL_08120 [Chthoniobacterales bacterium]